ALARMGKDVQAKKSLWRAIEVAERGGDPLSAGQAHLALIEELREQLLLSELAQHYEAADNLIGKAPDAALAARLRACARHCAKRLLVLDDRQGIDAFLSGGTLEQEVLRLEGELIRRALDRADGHITIAARMLGTSHQALAYMLSARHPNLLAARTPITPRRRSIIKKEAQKPRRARKS
ncbi:MAG TPA: helix-turn-helix domain-containing protein, partial [Pyrinomonadaceae bacterium]|nr:helix-turn-helix domain-containing protein [Pyrinomonadaceae bacterium]